jgi:hypothetical protein
MHFWKRIRDQELKFCLLIGGERALNEAICRALRLEAAEATATIPARLHMVRAGMTVTRD